MKNLVFIYTKIRAQKYKLQYDEESSNVTGGTTKSILWSKFCYSCMIKLSSSLGYFVKSS